MPYSRPPPEPGSLFARYGAKVVEEKLRNLRLVRALDRAGVDLGGGEGLETAILQMAHYDGLLTSMLELMDRDGREGEMVTDPVRPALRIAEEVRGAVMEALDAEDQYEVRHAMNEVAASEPEVWMEVEALRRMPMSAGPLSALEAPVFDLEPMGESRITFAPDRPPRPPGHKDVVAQENRPLPPTDAPLSAWFARLPAVWLEATATLNDVEIGRGDAALPARIAERLADAAWIPRLLTERVGASGREILASLLETGSAPFAAMSRRMRAALEVPWDWRGGLPPTDGGKLRVAGLVHVGTRGGAKVVEIPPTLLAVLRRVV